MKLVKQRSNFGNVTGIKQKYTERRIHHLIYTVRMWAHPRVSKRQTTSAFIKPAVCFPPIWDRERDFNSNQTPAIRLVIKSIGLCIHFKVNAVNVECLI